MTRPFTSWESTSGSASSTSRRHLTPDEVEYIKRHPDWRRVFHRWKDAERRMAVYDEPPIDGSVNDLKREVHRVRNTLLAQYHQRQQPLADSDKIHAYASTFPKGQLQKTLYTIASKARDGSLAHAVFNCTRSTHILPLRDLLIQHVEKAVGHSLDLTPYMGLRGKRVSYAT